MTRYHLLAFAVGLVAGAHLLRGRESSCCQRVGIGARDKISSMTGAAAPLTSKILDGLGLTQSLPTLLDLFGVPKDA